MASHDPGIDAIVEQDQGTREQIKHTFVGFIGLCEYLDEFDEIAGVTESIEIQREIAEGFHRLNRTHHIEIPTCCELQSHPTADIEIRSGAALCFACTLGDEIQTTILRRKHNQNTVGFAVTTSIQHNSFGRIVTVAVEHGLLAPGQNARPSLYCQPLRGKNAPSYSSLRL